MNANELIRIMNEIERNNDFELDVQQQMWLLYRIKGDAKELIYSSSEIGASQYKTSMVLIALEKSKK